MYDTCSQNTPLQTDPNNTIKHTKTTYISQCHHTYLITELLLCMMFFFLRNYSPPHLFMEKKVHVLHNIKYTVPCVCISILHIRCLNFIIEHDLWNYLFQKIYGEDENIPFLCLKFTKSKKKKKNKISFLSNYPGKNTKVFS